MTNQQYDLRLAIAYYLDNEAIIIPPYYHDHIVDAYNRGPLTWDADQAAALTLFSAYYDSVLQLSDLTYPGLIALRRAIYLVDTLNIQPSVAKPAQLKIAGKTQVA